MKVFISLPINNKSKKDIEKARIEAQAEVSEYYKDRELEFIDTWIKEDPPEELKDSDKCGLWYLSKSLEILTQADVLYCAKGWSGFRGCVIEHDSAIFYKIKVVTYAMYLASKGYVP